MPIIERATRNRTAVFGGTFDPPHIGHMHIFHEVAEHTPFRNLLVIPARISNFKQESRPASFSDRLEMVRLLAEDYGESYPEDDLGIIISDWEGRREAVSFTSDTVKHFYSSLEYDGKLDFIIGDDHLEKLGQWHDFGYLAEHVRFWCFSRGRDALPPASASVIMVKSDIVDASSTEIRHGNLDMLSESVREYVNEHGLYRAE